MTAAFDPRTEAKQLASLAAPKQKTPEGVLVGAATGKFGQESTIFILVSLVKNMSLTTLSHSRQSRIVPTFDSRTRVKQFTRLAVLYVKIPVRGSLLRGRLPGIEPELSVPQTDALTVIL